MKTRLFSTILLVFTSLFSPLFAQISPQRADIERFVHAADSLRKAADARITDLQSEIRQAQKALVLKDGLIAYDNRTLKALTDSLATAEGDRQTADEQFAQVRKLLPRRIRSVASVSPEATVKAVEDYVATLQKRSWCMGGVGLVVGVLGTLFLLVR